jgi:hypothetical protein
MLSVVGFGRDRRPVVRIFTSVTGGAAQPAAAAGSLPYTIECGAPHIWGDSSPHLARRVSAE